jgi:DivIVA domain-containing protein
MPHDVRTRRGGEVVLVLEIIVAAAVLVGVAVLASRDMGGLEDDPTDHGDLGLPEGRPVRSDDIARVRLRAVAGFWGGLRGYRYGDVDAVLDRVEETLRGWEEAGPPSPAPSAPARRAASGRPTKRSPGKVEPGEA